MQQGRPTDPGPCAVVVVTAGLPQPSGTCRGRRARQSTPIEGPDRTGSGQRLGTLGAFEEGGRGYARGVGHRQQGQASHARLGGRWRRTSPHLSSCSPPCRLAFPPSLPSSLQYGVAMHTEGADHGCGPLWRGGRRARSAPGTRCGRWHRPRAQSSTLPAHPGPSPSHTSCS